MQLLKHYLVLTMGEHDMYVRKNVQKKKTMGRLGVEIRRCMGVAGGG